MTGRSAQVSRGLMTIAANIANNADALKAYGIEVANQDGSLRSTYDVLKDLSEIWGTMTDTERVALGQVLAGKNQFKVLTSILSNFSHAISATETAYNSAGSAARENAKYMESLEAKTTNLSATFQKLANDIISKELVGSVLDLTNGLVSLADTGFGQVLTKAGLFAGAGFGLSQLNAVTKFLPTVTKQFTNLYNVITLTAGGAGTLGESFVAMGGFAGTALPVLLAVGVAIFGIVEAVKAYKAAHPDLETLGQQFKDEKEAIDDTKKSLQEAKNDLDTLNNTPVSDRSSHWVEETERLKNLCLYYEYLLQLQEKEAGETAQKYRTSDKESGYVATGSGVESRSIGSTESAAALGKTYGSEAEAIYAISNALNIVPKNASNAEEALDSLRKQLNSLGIQIDAVKISADEYNYQQANAIATFLDEVSVTDDLTRAQQERQQALLADNQIMYQVLAASTNLNASEIALKTAYEQLAISVASANGSIDDSYQIIANLANMLGFTPQQAYEFAVSMGAIDSAVRPLPGVFQQLADGTWVVSESLSRINEDAEEASSSLREVANASYTGSDAAYQMAQQLLNIGTASDTSSNAFRNLVAQEIIFNNTHLDVSSKIKALQQLALQAGATAGAIAGVTYASGGTTFVDSQGKTRQMAPSKKAQNNALIDYYNDLIDTIPEQTPTTYGGGGGGSVQKAKDEIEKNAQDTLNNVSSMTSQTIEDSANEAKEQAKKTLDAISKAVKEFYDEKIKALKEQNEEIDKQVQLEEKLRALEEAKNKQILLYEDGEYRYGQDLGAIAAAQKDYDKFVADMERDAQIKVLEDTRDKILKVLEQIEANLDNYTESQLSSISSLSSSITSSVTNISNIVGNTSSGIFAALQALLSGLDTSGSGGSLDLTSLLSMFGGGSSGSYGGGSGQTMFLNQMRGDKQAMLELAMRNKLMSERQWKKGQLLSLAYQADTDIPLDVQWWMSMFEAEMSDIIRGGTGNIGAGDPRGLDPDASKHVDVQYWLDQIANANDLYEAMDYYARAQAAGYVLAEFADGYFDALGYKNFDPKSIYQDMRNAYKRQYATNKDAVLMTRFHQYYSAGQNLQSNASGSAFYYNQNDTLADAMWSALTGEQMYRLRSRGLGRSELAGLYSAKAADDYDKLSADDKERYEAEAAQNRAYLMQELEKQIKQNSEDWFGATPEEQAALHNANEYYREYLAKLQAGDYEGLGGWNWSPASDVYQNQKHSGGFQSYTGEVIMYRNGKPIETAVEDVIPEIAESLGIPTDYGTTTGVAAQGSLLDNIGSNGTTNYNINIDNVELPGVVDSDGFITGLRNLAYQYAYTRQ